MIDDYIDEINRRLVATARQRARIVEDVRDHLADAIERLVAQGVDRPTAEQRAISAFGSAIDLAQQFNGHAAASALRRAPLLMAGCGLAVVAGFVFAAMSQRSPASPQPAGIIQQIAFFAAVLGLQFAIVAGLRVVVRAGARWRTTPRASDHLLLRRASVVFVTGLAVAATGWTVVLAEVLDGLSSRRAAPLAVGIVVMLSATIVAGVGITRRWPKVIAAEHTSATATGIVESSVFGAAEHGIRWMGSHGGAACAVAAIVSGSAAMSHAETTVLGALPWGVTQATAVIAGYVLLGRSLELRPAKPARPISG